MHRASLRALVLCAALTACGGSDSPADPVDDDPPLGPYGEPDPGPGAHFTVSPIELDKIAHITPVGTNGKILPLGHTYWYTCGLWWLFPLDRPCVREHLPIRSPVDGVVWAVEHVPDGEITIQGPPGLYAGFAHVTPRADLQRLDSVKAGDTIAVMYTDFAIDFGMTDYGIEPHRFVNQPRYEFSPGYLHARSPLHRFTEPLRSELLSRVGARSDSYGRIAFDVAGTAAGNWFLEGVPFDESFAAPWGQAQLFLGPLQEWYEAQIVSKEGWFVAVLTLAVVDPEAPRWDEVTPATGRVWVRLWQVTREGTPDLERPMGSVLVEVLEGERLRIEWFDTHDEPADFTAAAEMYER